MAVKLPIAKLPEFLQNTFDGKPHRYSFLKLRTECNLTKSARTDKAKGIKTSLNDFFKHPDGVEIVGIVKESEGMFSFNIDYEKKVNTELDKAGYEKNFEAASLPWGQYVEGSRTLITHKGEYYFRIYPDYDTAVAQSVAESKFYFVYSDGMEVEMTEEELKLAKVEFMDKEKEKKPITESFDEFKPIVMSPKITSLREIHINGEDYIIKY